jgi:DNA mismatch repair protein MutS
MMRQYLRIKQDHKDAILLYHMGDFYEMFYEDAENASKILGIALTTRDRHKGDGIPLCGIPCHAAETYINRLLAAGKKVAICDQMEDASASRGLVRREVTRIISPGTILDDKMLEGRANNFLVAAVPGHSFTGLAAADLSTGEFFVLETAADDTHTFEDRMAFFSPAEVVVPSGTKSEFLDDVVRAAPSAMLSHAPPETFDTLLARETLLSHFSLQTLEPFGCDQLKVGTAAAGGLLAYITESQRRPLTHITALTPFETGEFLGLDASTQRNLELVCNLEDGKKAGSLLGALDVTSTAMGGRKLRSWILSPLMNRALIEERLDAVEELSGEREKRSSLRRHLEDIYDLERLASRITLNSCTPRDLASLRNSLRAFPALLADLKR